MTPPPDVRQPNASLTRMASSIHVASDGRKGVTLLVSRSTHALMVSRSFATSRVD